MSSPWEHLLASTVSPAAAVAVKMAAVVEEDVEPDAGRRDGLMASLRRRLPFGRMSLGSGPKKGTPMWRYRQTRFSSRRVRKRVVFKNGECNVVQGNVAKRRRRYLQDIFTTLVDAQWRWTLLVFALNFLLSWLAFASLWFLVALAHGDLPKSVADTAGNETATETHTPCVEGLTGFTSCFLFSVETQHTIGYGSRSPTEECPEAIFILCLQSICGVMIQAFMVGIVFAKLSRPKKRTQTLLFSRHAVVCQRDGALCLMFRVGDMRKSHIVEAHVRAQIIRKRTTLEGEVIPFCQHELRVGGDGDDDRIFFIWPTVISHRIDADSPLYGLSAADMLRERFEIVVILEGVIESTGMTTQARSSYLPSEVLWGHRFRPMVAFRKGSAEYEVDYSLFDATYPVDTPLCSAKHLDDVKINVLRESGVSDETLLRTLDRLMLPRLPALGPAPPTTPPDPPSEGAVQGETDQWGDGVCVQLPRDLPGPESRI